MKPRIRRRTFEDPPTTNTRCIGDSLRRLVRLLLPIIPPHPEGRRAMANMSECSKLMPARPHWLHVLSADQPQPFPGGINRPWL